MYLGVLGFYSPRWSLICSPGHRVCEDSSYATTLELLFLMGWGSWNRFYLEYFEEDEKGERKGKRVTCARVRARGGSPRNERAPGHTSREEMWVTRVLSHMGTHTTWAYAVDSPVGVKKWGKRMDLNELPPFVVPWNKVEASLLMLHKTFCKTECDGLGCDGWPVSQ